MIRCARIDHQTARETFTERHAVEPDEDPQGFERFLAELEDDAAADHAETHGLAR